MARIITPEEIARGNVPDDDAPYRAASYIVQHALIGGECLGVTAGMVFGSVAMDTADRLSDVDVLLTYDGKQARSALPLIGRVILEARRQYCVPVEELVYRCDSLKPGCRSLDPFSVEHWHEIQRRYPEQWSYRNPVKDWTPLADTSADCPDTIRGTIQRYLTTKIDIYGYGMMKSGTPDLRKMQKALELPRSLGRKMLALTHSGDEFHARASFDKDWTSKEMQHVFASPGEGAQYAREQFSYLLDTNTSYKTVLAETLEGGMTISEYTAWLNENYFSCCSAAYDVCVFCQTLLTPQV